MLELKKYENPKLFWNEVSPHLKKEEAKNNLSLGLSYRFQSHPEECLYQSALYEEKELVGALIGSRYRTQNILLPTPLKHPKYAKELLQDFQQSNKTISGLVGERNSVQVYERLLREFGKKTQIIMIQGIYKCDHVVLPNDAHLFPFRPAKLEDSKTIGEWIESFHREATPHDPVANFLELAQLKIKDKMIFVIESEGKPVSMAAWSRDIGTSCSINLVFTPINYRKRGYGSIVTAKLTQHLFDNGKRETNLYTDMNNLTSNKIYQNIGYQFVCDSIHLGVDSL